MLLLELTILEILFSSIFCYMPWHFELKFCVWLCFTVLQIKFECHKFLSIFVGRVMPLLGLRILEIHSCKTWFLIWYEVGGRAGVNNWFRDCKSDTFWDIVMKLHTLTPHESRMCAINLIYCRSTRESSLSVHLALSPSIHFLHIPPTCIDKFSWKFVVCFFNAFLLEKCTLEKI